MKHFDVIVIGAGAAGLLAASKAAESGASTLLLEKNNKPGVKILISGGTRCNITHATDYKGIIAAFGKNGKFLHSAVAALGPEAVIELVERNGVPTKVEDTGKVFPKSNRAIDVRDAFVRILQASGAELSLGDSVEAVRYNPPIRFPKSNAGSDVDHSSAHNPSFDSARFEVVTSRRKRTARRLIVTTGGQSYPGCGTTGDGYVWAQELGHKIIPPDPALVPLTTRSAWVPTLQGLTLPDVFVRVHDPAMGPHNKKNALAARRSSLLFTHFGLSGPAAMDVSRVVSQHIESKSLKLVCDFLPNQTEQELDATFDRAFREAGKRTLQNILATILPRRLAETILELANIQPDRRVAEVSKKERRQIISQIKSSEIALLGTQGFKKAEVTAGGVALDEIDSRTMESRIVPGLYFAGEIINLDGPIGGFNFQAAFSTGWLAGVSAGNSIASE